MKEKLLLDQILFSISKLEANVLARSLALHKANWKQKMMLLVCRAINYQTSSVLEQGQYQDCGWGKGWFSLENRMGAHDLHQILPHSHIFSHNQDPLLLLELQLYIHFDCPSKCSICSFLSLTIYHIPLALVPA